MESIDTLKAKLTAIGKSIRTVRKEPDTYTLDEMPEKIRTLTLGSETPDYTDGKDHYLIDIVAGEEFPVYVYYYIPSGGTLTIEWGDGKSDTVSGANGAVETAHTYGYTGSYEIKVSCDTDGWYPYGTSTSGVLGQYTSSSKSEAGRCLDRSRLSEIHLADRSMNLIDYSIGNFYRLMKFTIPSGVTSIGSNAFYYCKNLKYIELKPTTPPTLSSSTAFDRTNNCPIYVPDESVDTYKAASQWSSLASRIYGISEKGE